MTGVLVDPAFANTMPPQQGVLPPAPQGAPDPYAAILNALQTPDQQLHQFAKQHIVQAALSALGGALTDAAAGIRGQPSNASAANMQNLYARAAQPLQLMQQAAQTEGMRNFYQSLGPQDRAAFMSDPQGFTAQYIKNNQLVKTAGGEQLQNQQTQTLQTPVITPPAPGPVASVTGPTSFQALGSVPEGHTLGVNQNYDYTQPQVAASPQIPIIGQNGQPTGQTAPTRPAAYPSSAQGPKSGGPMTQAEIDSYNQPPGTTGFWDANHNPSFIPPQLTEKDWNTQADTGYVNNDQHKDAVGRAQALTAVGNILSTLPPGALSSQALLNGFVMSQTSRENPTRPATIEQLLTRMGVPEQAFSTLTGLSSVRGQQITPENIKNMYRSIYEETAPRVDTDSKLLAPIVSDAQRYHFNATPYVGMHPQLPDVPSFARDALPDPKSRKVGQVVWGAKGPAKWNGQKWTLIGQ